MSKNAWIGLVAAVVAAAVIALGLWLFIVQPGSEAPTATATPTVSASPSAGAVPTRSSTPTSAPSATPTTTPTPTPTAQPQIEVTPLITFDDWDAGTRTLSVGGNVSGVVSDDGTCTLSASGVESGVTLEATFPAQSTGTTMDCGPMSLTSAQLDTGTWLITLSYSSARAAGSTSGYEVYIP